MDVSVSGILHTPAIRSPDCTVLVCPCLYLYLYPDPACVFRLSRGDLLHNYRCNAMIIAQPTVQTLYFIYCQARDCLGQGLMVWILKKDNSNDVPQCIPWQWHRCWPVGTPLRSPTQRLAPNCCPQAPAQSTVCPLSPIIPLLHLKYAENLIF